MFPPKNLIKQYAEAKRVLNMSDFVKLHLDQLEPQVRAMVAEIIRVQVFRFRAAPCWSPALNVYRRPDRLIVCVDLAGVSEQESGTRSRRATTLVARVPGIDDMMYQLVL